MHHFVEHYHKSSSLGTKILSFLYKMSICDNSLLISFNSRIQGRVHFTRFGHCQVSICENNQTKTFIYGFLELFYFSLTYFSFNKSIFFFISPLLLLKIVVPETSIFAPASIASFELSKLIPPSISISKLRF